MTSPAPVAMVAPRGPAAKPPQRIGVKVMLHPDTYERVKYWAAKDGVSANEAIAEAVEKSIATRNYDYDVPDLLLQRINQLIDQDKSMSENMASLERVVYDGLGSLVVLARGDDYLVTVEPEAR